MFQLFVFFFLLFLGFIFCWMGNIIQKYDDDLDEWIDKYFKKIYKKGDGNK